MKLKLPLFFARRYLFSKKSTNAINIISGISVAGFTVGSMALIIILSVLNGLEVLVFSLFHTIDPDLKITPRNGKVFEPAAIHAQDIRSIPGISNVVEVLEENAVIRYGDAQDIATIKGVESGYTKTSRIDTTLVQGDMVLEVDDKNFALVGNALAYRMSVDVSNPFSSLFVYVPKRGAVSALNPEKALNQLSIKPSGVFAIQEEIDNKYIIVPLRFAREILEYPTAVSALEISLKEDASLEEIRKKIEELAGKDFDVKDRYQQQELIYKIFKSEKWATYAILSFILLVAAFNVIGSLTMLVIEKKRDISVLKSMGASNKLISRIFLVEGMLIALMGAFSGLLLGLFVCWLQMEFGFIKFEGGGSFVVDAYPVKIVWSDCLLVFGTTLILGYITSIYPAIKSSQQEEIREE